MFLFQKAVTVSTTENSRLPGEGDERKHGVVRGKKEFDDEERESTGMR